MSSRTRRTTVKGGPLWSDVVARVTADAVNGEILDSEPARDITRSLEHTPLEGGPRDIQTILVFEASKVKSPSPILQDSVRRAGSTTAGTHVNSSWTHGVLSVKEITVFQACVVVSQDRWYVFENHTEW